MFILHLYIFSSFLIQWLQIEKFDAACSMEGIKAQVASPCERNLLDLSSKVLCLTVNQRAANKTETQEVNSTVAAAVRAAEAEATRSTLPIVALPLPPQSTPFQSIPLQLMLRSRHSLRSAAITTQNTRG